jgi:hypothetical protein
MWFGYTGEIEFEWLSELIRETYSFLILLELQVEKLEFNSLLGLGIFDLFILSSHMLLKLFDYKLFMLLLFSKKLDVSSIFCWFLYYKSSLFSKSFYWSNSFLIVGLFSKYSDLKLSSTSI